MKQRLLLYISAPTYSLSSTETITHLIEKQYRSQSLAHLMYQKWRAFVFQLVLDLSTANLFRQARGLTNQSQLRLFLIFQSNIVYHHHYYCIVITTYVISSG